VCWHVTTRCNLSCRICYGYPEPVEAPLATQTRVLDRLAELDPEKVMFTGGEPLLDPNLHLLAQRAKEWGLKVGLSTNCMLLSAERQAVLLPWVDELTIPIEGSSRSIHARSRGSELHFDVVLDLLLSGRMEGVELDASTVVSAFNVHDLIDIGQILQRARIRKWKVFQFVPLANGRLIGEAACISTCVFREKVSELRSEFADSISIDAREHSKENLLSYVNVLATGTIVMPIGGSHRPIGNVLETNDIASLLEENGFDFARHTSRHWRDVVDTSGSDT